MSLHLNDDELYEVTGYRQRAKQIEVLAKLSPKVEFRVRPGDSFPLVPRWQFEGPAKLSAFRAKSEPNYGGAYG
jgi:hypothetical protein